MSPNDDQPSPGAIDRREALKKAAQVAGVAAFATPVVAGVFSAPAMAQVVDCTPEGDSDAVFGIFATGASWNQNCGGSADEPNGRYNGQDHLVTVAGQAGAVIVGNPGNDNFQTSQSFYLVRVAGYECEATFVYGGCAVATLISTPIAGAPADAQGVPYCPNACPPVGNGPAGRLFLQSVTCCPT